jgi:hypothetical protein
MRTSPVMGLIVAVYCLILSGFIGCNEVGIDPPPPLPYANDPTEVIFRIEIAFLVHNLRGLQEWLDEGFTFYFKEDDVGDDFGDGIVPESWTRFEFLEAVSSLFEHRGGFGLLMTPDTLEGPEGEDLVFTAKDVEVTFNIDDDLNRRLKIEGTFDLEFVCLGLNAKGEYEWRVTKWRDFTIASNSDETGFAACSFGEVLLELYNPGLVLGRFKCG